MKKYDPVLYLICAVFFVAAAVNAFYPGRGNVNSSGEDLSIEAARDGQVIMTTPLREIHSPTMKFGEPGNFNEIAVGDGVRMASADCPGGDCLRMSAAGNAGEMIVCLPHRFVIRLVSPGKPFVDATSY